MRTRGRTRHRHHTRLHRRRQTRGRLRTRVTHLHGRRRRCRGILRGVGRGNSTRRITGLRSGLTSVGGSVGSISCQTTGVQTNCICIVDSINTFNKHVIGVNVAQHLRPVSHMHRLSSTSIPFGFSIRTLFFSGSTISLRAVLRRRFRSEHIGGIGTHGRFCCYAPRRILSGLGRGSITIIRCGIRPSTRRCHIDRTVTTGRGVKTTPIST